MPSKRTFVAIGVAPDLTAELGDVGVTTALTKTALFQGHSRSGARPYNENIAHVSIGALH